MPELDPDIENRFSHHAPQPGQKEKYEDIRERAKELAYLLTELCPVSRERATALTHLDATVMFANAAIARNS